VKTIENLETELLKLDFYFEKNYKNGNVRAEISRFSKRVQYVR